MADYKRKEDEYGLAYEAAQSAADRALANAQNRQPFSYDLNGDALFNQYKDKYTALGRAAMEDTVGKAAQMTGGYMNSYASTAGQQAYNQYLTQLGDMALSLEGRAYDRYRDGIADARQDYSYLADAADRAYSRYQDQVKAGRYEDETAYARGQDALDQRYRYDSLLASTGYDFSTDDGRQAFRDAAQAVRENPSSAAAPANAEKIVTQMQKYIDEGDTDAALRYLDAMTQDPAYHAWADYIGDLYGLGNAVGGGSTEGGSGGAGGNGSSGASGGSGAGSGVGTGTGYGEDEDGVLGSAAMTSVMSGLSGGSKFDRAGMNSSEDPFFDNPARGGVKSDGDLEWYLNAMEKDAKAKYKPYQDKHKRTGYQE